MSLYLPDTGYVQGMAALTATLLCYYDEEKAFVMLVRLWQLRGLERLYESGFEGLMEALKDFEENWLAEGDVAKKLVSVDPISWGHVRAQLGQSFILVAEAARTLRNWFLAPILGVALIWTLIGGAQYHFDGLWHPMVSNSVQLFDTVPSTAPGLGRFHAPRRRLELELTDFFIQRRSRRSPRNVSRAHRRDKGDLTRFRL